MIHPIQVICEDDYEKHVGFAIDLAAHYRKGSYIFAFSGV